METWVLRAKVSGFGIALKSAVIFQETWLSLSAYGKALL
jgi:hypothetical protein